MTETETNRYANSKIYKLIDDEGYYYWGSCAQPDLRKRYFDHKKASKRDPERKIYKVFTHERFINNEIRIVLEKCLSLSSKQELLREENIYIEASLEDEKCLNYNRAVQNYDVTREYRRLYLKGYCEAHREEKRVYDEEYRCAHLEHKNTIDKEYRERHIEEKRAVNRAYYLENKDKINEIVMCECGDKVVKQYLKRHQQTQRHNKQLNR